MSKNTLPVDFQDDILNATMGGKRRYNLVQNADGTVSLEDVTTYDQIGSNFSAAQVNETNEAVNESFDKNRIIVEKDDVLAVTDQGYVVDATVIKVLYNQLYGELEDIAGNLKTGMLKIQTIARNVSVGTSTTMQYVGLSVTIPANSHFVITARAAWYNSQPVAVRITTSSTSSSTDVASGQGGTASATATVSGYASQEQTFYVWAQYGTAANNTIFLDGFYIYE